jgi:hypothetical protein
VNFADATAVTPVADGVFEVLIPAEWGFRGRPNGGFLLALAARAALAATGRPHPLVVSGAFLRSPESGPAQVRVEILKAGRAATHTQVTVFQHEVAMLATQVAVGEPEEADPAWLERPDPAPAPYDRCVPVPFRAERTGLLEQLDMRYDPAAPPDLAGRAGEARIRGWVEFRDGSAPDALAAILAADVLPPSVLNVGLAGWAPTVQMTVYVRRAPVAGPLGVSVAARLAAGQWFDEVSDVYDTSGALVAQGRQLALVPRSGS